MDETEQNKFKSLLPGRYVLQMDSDTFLLFLEGSVDGPTPFGDSFSLMFSHSNGDGSGVSRTISGPYRLESGKLVLDAKKISRESWSKEEEAEGEAFVEDYNKGPITAEVEAPDDKPVLKLSAFDRDLEIKKSQ